MTNEWKPTEINEGQPTTEELQEVLDGIVKELKENSQEMDDECRKVLYDNLWDLYDDTSQTVPPEPNPPPKVL